MRRNYISPEYHNNNISGTFNMVEESNFFGGKMLEVEDSLLIDNIDIIWYQKSNNEQFNISIESSLNSYFYSPSADKLSNHRLYIDNSQSEYQKERNTKWILEINIQKIFENYLFATLKKYRTFEGVSNINTISNDVDVSIKNYIKNNISDRYKYSKIDFYIEYKDINEQEAMRYTNTWDITLPAESLYNKYKTTGNDSIVKISFEQQNSSMYVFNYFFNILYEKI